MQYKISLSIFEKISKSQFLVNFAKYTDVDIHQSAMHFGGCSHISWFYNAIIACREDIVVFLSVWYIFLQFKVDNGIAHGMIHAEPDGWVEMSDYQGFMNT